MFHRFPYDDIAKQLAGIVAPYSVDKFEGFFQSVSNETTTQHLQQIDIQFDLYDVFLISPKEINEEYRSVPPAYFFYRIQAVLLAGRDRFYLMVHCGKDRLITNHTFNQNIDFMKNSPSDFRKLGPGRYANISSGNFVSAEEDEFDMRYILLTNSDWLLQSNEIFNFSRNFFTI